MGFGASYSLLHAPRAEMPRHLAAIARALRPDGVLSLTLKEGQGEARDPGGSLRVRAMAQRAVARPLHAGPPSRRPPPLQPSRRPSSR